MNTLTVIFLKELGFENVFLLPKLTNLQRFGKKTVVKTVGTKNKAKKCIVFVRVEFSG
jgi:hypothetical protein